MGFGSSRAGGELTKILDSLTTDTPGKEQCVAMPIAELFKNYILLESSIIPLSSNACI